MFLSRAVYVLELLQLGSGNPGVQPRGIVRGLSRAKVIPYQALEWAAPIAH